MGLFIDPTLTTMKQPKTDLTPDILLSLASLFQEPEDEHEGCDPDYYDDILN